MSDPCRFTLVRPAAESTRSEPVVVTSATPMPLAAGSELRVTADVRRTSWDMAEAYTSLDPVEALCSIERRSAATYTEPGVVLLDHRFPIWLAVFDDEVFISVDTELLEGAARRRFEAASRYVQFLVARGYSRVFDHQLKRVRELAASGEGIVEWLARWGSSRVFDRLRTDRRIGFVTGVIGFLVTDLAMHWSSTDARPVWLTLLRALVLGFFINALQYYQARKALTERLEQLRTEVITGAGPAERLTFRRPTQAIWSEILAVVIFGAFAAIGVYAGMWAVGTFLTCAFLLATASLLLRHQLRVELDGQSIEGWSVSGRTRLRYADIDRIREYQFPHLTVISSERGTIWAPASLKHYRQLVDVVWERTDGSVATNFDEALVTNESAEALRASLQRSRQQAYFGWELLEAARQPLWLLVFARNYPLRKQFPWHAHLLKRGRVTFGLVIDADPALAHPQRNEDAHDGFAVVLFGSDLPVEVTGEVLNDVADRVRTSEADNSASKEVESFKSHLDDCWPFPALVEVPRELTRGYLVYCTSVLVVLRHMPLGYLSSTWIPLLVDPSESPHVMILPMRYWPEAWRQQWKAGPPQQSEHRG